MQGHYDGKPGADAQGRKYRQSGANGQNPYGRQAAPGRQGQNGAFGGANGQNPCGRQAAPGRQGRNGAFGGANGQNPCERQPVPGRQGMPGPAAGGGSGGWQPMSEIGNTYVIDGEIGSGSGGIVYKAWHKRLQKPVVLKKMKITRSNINENRRETDILKRLRHSYLPGVIDFIDVNGEVFTVMDYIEGQSLSAVMKRGRRFSQEETVKYGGQLLEALIYLHGQMPPVLHGDIKPSNIMLTPEGNICLIDFNISGYLTDNRLFVKGYTQGYAAPEQVFAIQRAINTGSRVPSGSFDERADLFSVGAVLFTLLTGYLPGRDWDPMQEILEQMQVSDGLISVIWRAMRPDPQQRYRSAEEMLEELRNYRKKERSYRQKVIRRRVLLLCAAAAVLAVLVITAGVFRIRRNAKEKEYQGNLTRLETLAQEAGTAGGSNQAFDGKYEEALNLYENCGDLYPDRLEPLVQMARFLYLSKEYDACIQLIRSDLVEPDGKPSDPKSYGEVCYLLGNAFYEKGDLEEAVQAYEKAVDNTESNPDFFRDYAIALAQSGDIEGAEKILDEADRYGLRESQIALVQGEICSREGRYEEAISNFDFCIEQAEDDTDRLRACLLEEKAYEGKGITADNMLMAAQMLEDARMRLPEDKKAPVLERLAQVYIYLYDLTEISTYAQNSIDVFDQIIRSGWGSALTYNNIVTMYQKIDNLDKAGEYLDQMEQLWPDDYRTFKRRAFLEQAYQERLDPDDRDYSRFAQYCTKAQELFSGQGGDVSQDPEMGILDDIYRQLGEKGWL